MEQRERLIELLKQADEHAVRRLITDYNEAIADNASYLLDNGVIVPPCKVGDKVYYINTQYHIALYRNKIYEAKVARMVVTSLGVCLVIHIKDESGCCEIPDIRDFGKTVFLTREEAKKALAERSG